MVSQSNHGPLRDLAIVDPTFNSSRQYLEVLAKLSGYKGKLSLQCRLEMISDDLVHDLRRSGSRSPTIWFTISDDLVHAVLDLSRTANVVLEFGVQTIHKNEQRLIERPSNQKSIENWLAILNAHGVPYELSFIYGLPEQTLDSFRRTLEWAEHKCSDHASSRAVARFWPLMLLRGTQLHKRRSELGLVTTEALQVDISGRVGSSIPHVIASHTFTFDDWLVMNQEAERVNEVELALVPD